MKTVFILLAAVAAITFIILAGGWYVIGVTGKARKRESLSEFIIDTPNRIDYQRSTECSGYSSAHVLRGLGVDAVGDDLYAGMPGRLPNGAVMPANLKKALRRMGFKAKYLKGDLETVKADLSEGKRVIALIKTREDKYWLHYVPVVGYDGEDVFIAESMYSLANCSEKHYNRKLSRGEFLRLWDTRAWFMPFYKNTYLTVERLEEEHDGR